MHKMAGFLALGMTLVMNQALALDKVEERYVSQLVNGRATQIREAAESIYNQRIDNREVLDIATEVLLQQYRENTGGSYSDAFSWVCKAIGQSGDGRYRASLEKVANTTKDKRLKKHCKKGYKKLSGSSDSMYRAGDVSLVAYEKEIEPTTPDMNQLSDIAKEALTSGEHPFSLVREGMSMEEVQVVVGSPNNLTSMRTGKAFIPFYSGGDGARMSGLYKGLGYIVYNRRGAFSSQWIVMEVVEDQSELGYR